MFKKLFLALMLSLCLVFASSAMAVEAGQTCTVPEGTAVIIITQNGIGPGVAPEGGRDVLVVDPQPTVEEWQEITSSLGIDYSDGVVLYDEPVSVYIIVHENELTNCR